MTMQLSLSGPWQLSPLTDVSIPQVDLYFPNPFSCALPSELAEHDLAQQEWHLMHDIEVDDHLLAFAAIDVVIEGIDYPAEVRLNGAAIFDCDGTQHRYKKEIRLLLKLGRNRFEILFLNQEDDWLIEEPICPLGEEKRVAYDSRMGIWRAPYLQAISHLRLEHLTTEQIWHHGGGCELLVNLYFTTYASGLVSAAVRFDGMTYHLPIDVRSDHVTAIFQVDAPRYYDAEKPNPEDLYTIDVELDGQQASVKLALSDTLCVTHFPL
ncbi:beta-galactosidase/beta-glucuronidase [Vibrio metschnikovii]|nr:beta-galactosidase/beta-glucuronidase [Vibrio metschnikovii CIP 69.14]SUP08040.1 beta-galactosidase/beta-glucuronidase [Vibrio metschnikovii]